MSTHTTSHLHDRLDPAFRPQDDLYNHVNATWIKANPIPSHEVRWGVFNILAEKSEMDMLAICKNLLTTEHKVGSIEQKIGDLFWTALHKDELAETHLREMANEYAKIDALTNAKTLSAYPGEAHPRGISTLWAFGVSVDKKNSKIFNVTISQGGLTLPDREYYLSDDVQHQTIRSAYIAFIDELTAKIDFAKDQISSGSILNFETDLARPMLPNAELRDVKKTYNPYTLATLKQTYAAIDWDAYFAASDWKPSGNIIVATPHYLSYINDLIATGDFERVQEYLRWRLVCSIAGAVNEEFNAISFNFFGKVLAGQKEQRSLERRAVSSVDQLLGQAVGRLYAAEHFPADSKHVVEVMIEDIRSAFSDRIAMLAWMEPATKAYAQQKLANMKVLVGYGVDERDYSLYPAKRTSYIANVLALRLAESRYDMSRVGTTPNREEMYMPPQMVNAYNDPSSLVIAFPAAILQTPFFDAEAPEVSNYAGIGSVIGHELTHGFDDQGCQYDADGNVRVWQTESDMEAFKREATKLSKLADEYEVLPDTFLKGPLVLGEAIADLGGVEIALSAYGRHLKRELSHDELKEFYLAYAACWCTAQTDEMTKTLAIVDPHPHHTFRVNGVVRHCDRYYEGFGVEPNDKLYLAEAERVRIW